MRSAIEIWRQTFKVFKNNPVVFLPFLIYLFFDLFALLLVFLAPQAPLSIVFAPIIKAFFGEQYLHYPVNFLLLPNLYNTAHIINSAIIGLLMAGTAIWLVYQRHNNQEANIFPAIIQARKRYLSFLAILLVFVLLGLLIYKIPKLLIQFSLL